MARTSKHRAREAADLLLLSLYVHIPPSRGLEIRTLEIVYEEGLASAFSPAEFRNRNVALLKRCGAVTLHVQSYKTSRFTGHDQIELRVSAEKRLSLSHRIQIFLAEVIARRRGFLFRPALLSVYNNNFYRGQNKYNYENTF